MVVVGGGGGGDDDVDVDVLPLSWVCPLLPPLDDCA
jgi:hypothetical protein